MKADITRNETQMDPANKLKDDELTGVSGGVDDLPPIFLFTKGEKECIEEFDFILCILGVHGRCPKLIIEKSSIDFKDFNYEDMDFKYTVSCSDGYFSKHTFTSWIGRI